ncbi:unnamed protein product [Orchesella dallaii]|uniref:O-acyltransferase WSD1 C-terminal domain-containing protein n=1 Tax=Orchesella dallaii TaxID=48710 RepID=A0ABP1QIG7_9HEXA
MSCLYSVIWLPLRFILLLLFSPIMTVVYWALVIVVGVPSQLFRKLVSFFARQLDGDLGNLVESTGGLLGRDFADLAISPSQTITVILKIKGKCDIQTLRNHILHTWVCKREGANGPLEYPELRQYITSRLGYLIFKWDREFDIANHVNLYDSGMTVVNDEKLQDIWENVSKRPFKSKRSPWEFFLIPNYYESQTQGKIFEKIPEEERHCVWILRLHHSMCDGFSIYRLLISLTDQGLPLWGRETACEVQKNFKFLMNFKALLSGPTSLAKVFLQGFDYLHDLHYSHNRLLRKYSIVTSSLDVQLVKNASKLHNISFHAVLIGALSGGIRKYLLENNLSIPHQPIRLGMPISHPNHTTKLRNEWLSAMINLPVRKKTAKLRVLAMKEILKELKRSSLIPVLTQSMAFISGFPFPAVRFLTKKSGTSVMYSEMRAPNVPLTFFEKRMTLTDLMYSFGLGTEDLGIGFNSISYNGKIKLILTLDQGIFNTKEKGELLMSYILSDLEDLQH